MTLPSNAAKLKALIELGIARQAVLDDEGQELYLRELADVRPEVVVAACGVLARRERREYETAYPTLGTVLVACRAALRGQEQARLEALARKALPMSTTPPSKAEAAVVMARLRLDVAKRRGKR